MTALVAGTELHVWLVELLPQRPPDAVNCGDCSGKSTIFFGDEPRGSVYCRTCNALGWSAPPTA